MQPLNFPLEGRIVGAAPDRPGATIQNCDLVSARFCSFRERSAHENSHETLQIGPMPLKWHFPKLRLHKKETTLKSYLRTFVPSYLRRYNTFVFWISGSCGHPGDTTTTTTTTTTTEILLLLLLLRMGGLTQEWRVIWKFSPRGCPQLPEIQNMIYDSNLYSTHTKEW